MTTFQIRTGLFSVSLALMAGSGILGCTNVSFTPSSLLPTETTASSNPQTDGRRKDTFLFNDGDTKAKVDVLMIDDNSGSMANKQAKLSTRLGSFISSLGQIDWQIGITTTDTSNGTFGLKGRLLTMSGTSSTILTKNVPNYETVFQNTVVRDETLTCTTDCPSSDERPLRAIIEAINKRNVENAGFFRQGAELAVVILSDEDEASDGNTSATLPSEVMTAFTAAFGSLKSMTAYGIVIAPTDTACFAAESLNGAKYANILTNFVLLTGGVTGSICDADYGPTLSDIGSRVLSGVRTANLSGDPTDKNIEVSVYPQDPSLSWTLEGKTITFNKPPAKGTRIEVLYLPM